jgi:histidine triad (HIT) family protein
MEQTCVFCKIIKRDLPSDIAYEDDDVIAFLDIKPVNPGHLLVIPKTHYPNLVMTPDEIISKVFIKVKELMPKLQDISKADYVALSVVGVDVPHFHVHLIPRFKKDGLADFWPTKNSEKEEREQIAKKLREGTKNK